MRQFPIAECIYLMSQLHNKCIDAEFWPWTFEKSKKLLTSLSPPSQKKRQVKHSFMIFIFEVAAIYRRQWNILFLIRELIVASGMMWEKFLYKHNFLEIFISSQKFCKTVNRRNLKILGPIFITHIPQIALRSCGVCSHSRVRYKFFRIISNQNQSHKDLVGKKKDFTVHNFHSFWSANFRHGTNPPELVV